MELAWMKIGVQSQKSNACAKSTDRKAIYVNAFVFYHYFFRVTQGQIDRRTGYPGLNKEIKVKAACKKKDRKIDHDE